MLIKKPGEIKSSEITDEKIYRQRREFMLARLPLHWGWRRRPVAL